MNSGQFSFDFNPQTFSAKIFNCVTLKLLLCDFSAQAGPISRPLLVHNNGVGLILCTGLTT